MTTYLQDRIAEWNRRDAIETGRAVSEVLGEEARAELLGYFVRCNPGLLKQTKGGKNEIYEATSHVMKDLQDLGIEFPEVPKILVPDNLPDSSGIVESVGEKQLSVPNYSKKELQLLLSKFIPDQTARKKIITLFWEEGFEQHISMGLRETLHGVEGVTDEEDEKMKEISLPTASILNAGKTKRTIQRNKKKRGIPRLDVKRTEKIIRLASFQSSRADLADNGNIEKEGISEASKEELVWTQQERLEEFVKSTFCFCVARLAEDPNILAWTAAPNEVIFQAPEWIQKKMMLIQSICDYYDDFFDYSPHLKEATRAFIRVTRGI